MYADERREKGRKLLLLLLLIFAVGGIFGFIYEELFYRIDLGYFVKRGTTYGPWIPIYGVGAVLILLTTGRWKDRPGMVFLVSTAVTGMLELAVGYGIHHIFGVRLWDYGKEIWNWGNVGGYICARSVLFFGFAALFLRYVICPWLEGLIERLPPRKALITAAVPAGLFLTDIVVSLAAMALGLK